MKKFGFYFKKGFVLARRAAKGKSFFTKLLLGLYLILSFFGKMIFFLRPIFLIGDNNLAMMIVEGQDFEINKVFEGVNAKKRYSSLLLSGMFVDGLAFIATLILVGPFGIWFATGLWNPYMPPYIFMIIFGVAAVVFTVILELCYAPMGFVTCKGKDLSCGDVLYLGKEGSVGIKGKIFGVCFVNYLLIILVMAVCFGIPLFMGLTIFDDEDYVHILVNIVATVLFLLFVFLDIFVLSKLRLSCKISLYSLYFDSVEAKHVVIARKANGKDVFVPLFADDKEPKNE